MQDNREALDLVGENKIIKFVTNPLHYYESKMKEYIKYYEPTDNVQNVYDDLHQNILKEINSFNEQKSGRRNFTPIKYGDKESFAILAHACCLRAWWNEATLEKFSVERPKDMDENRAIRLEAISENSFGELSINQAADGFFNQMRDYMRKTLYDDKCVKLLASSHRGLSPVINVDKFANTIYKLAIARYPSLDSRTPNKKEQELVRQAFAEVNRQIREVLYVCDFLQTDPFTL